MSSITTAVAADYRLQQWAQLVKECQNRPSDMMVEIPRASPNRIIIIVFDVSAKPVWSISRKVLFHASRLLRFLKTLCICQKVLPISRS